MNHLPGKLVKLRKHYNYSQGQIAEILGVDALEYMGYENGRAVLSYAQMKKLASFYHVDMDDIFRNSEEIPLKKAVNTNTDELNIRYFIPKQNIFQKFYALCRRHPLRTIAIILIAASCVIYAVTHKPEEIVYENEFRDINRLAVSETSVVYIDDSGKVYGTGDGSNGQLTDLPGGHAIKVAEGSSFTVVLDDEGNLHTYGLMGKTEEEIASWRYIVDVAAGDGHIIASDLKGKVYCAGDNSFGQCEISSFPPVRSVYASDRGSIGIAEDGKVYATGEFFASSLVKKYNDIYDIDASEENTVVLRDDHTVLCYSKSHSFLEAESWTGIIDVACGNDFIAGLDESGKVRIDIDNHLVREEVSTWEGVIAIAAADDYLIAYDGKTLRGIGRNAYQQFEKSELLRMELPQVDNVSIHIGAESLSVDFDPVEGASGYIVSVDAGIGLSQYTKEAATVSFPAENFTDGSSYTLTILAKGEGDYEDSEPSVHSFTYAAFREEEEEKFTVDDLYGKTKTNFEAYLRGLGYDMTKLSVSESDEVCEGGEAYVVAVEGIYEKESISHSELQNRQISVKYCKVVSADGEE